jgi:hypothetical protein
MKELHDLVAKFRNQKAQDLTKGKTNTDGTFTIGEINGTIEEILKVVNKYNDIAVDNLPLSQKAYLKSHLTQILKKIEEIKNTEIQSNTPLNQTKKPFLIYFDYSNPHNPTDNQYVAKHLPRIWEIISLANNTYNSNTLTSEKVIELEESYKKLLNDALEKNKELERKMIIRRNEMSGESISEHRLYFENDSFIFNSEARRWSRLLYILLGSVGVFTIGLFFATVVFDAFNEKLIEVAVFSGVIITFLSYTILFVVKNYNASRHNATLAKHRSNCLSTYEKLIEGESPNKKDIVIQYICQTIFPHQKSGYLSKEADGQSPNPLIDFASKIVDTKLS